MRQLLPNARSPLLAWTAAVLAIFYAVIAAGFVLHLKQEPAGLALAPLFALLAWGMWSLSRFARWVTLVWLWVVVVLLPLGIFMPAKVEETAPYWGTLVAGVTPFIVAGLFFIYVLGKHKREFKWP